MIAPSSPWSGLPLGCDGRSLAGHCRNVRSTPEFTVTYESHGLESARDAYELRLRVWRDGETLGLWSTSISGIDLVLRRRADLADGAFWRGVAIVLARVIEHEFQQSSAPTEWESDVHYLPTAADLPRIQTVAQSQPATPLESGEEITTFTA